MKLFIYSDLHICRTSSILPLSSDNYKYTYRQNMILNLGDYFANLIDEYKPDAIINLGDTFDNHTLTSYDINIASEFFKKFRMFNIPHLVLVGNHEMVNSNFNAVSLLNNIQNISVIYEPCTLNSSILKSNESNIKLAFLPYCNYKDILEYPAGDFLFSHIDIQGSSINKTITLPNGVDQKTLKDYYKLVFNGHIHKPSIFSNVINVGSCTSHSFSDDEESTPQCYIFDTDTLNLQTFKINVCPLFRKFKIENDINELYQYINNLNKDYKYLLNVTCPYELKESVKTYLQECTSILNYKLSIYTKNNLEKTNIEINTVINNLDIINSFNNFLKEIELKYPISLYKNVLNKEVN